MALDINFKRIFFLLLNKAALGKITDSIKKKQS